jgi:predicted N-acetyltransferase YhbS
MEIADLADQRQEIVSFWNMHLPGWRESKFDVFYRSNPAGEATCWVMRHDQTGEIAGSTAVFPRTLRIEGKSRLAAIAGDLGVASRHRRKGLALRLHQAVVEHCREADYEFVYGTANPASRVVVTRAGYREIGRTVRLVKVLKTRSYIERSGLLRPLAGFIARPADAVLRSHSYERRYVRPSGIATERPDRCDERFDSLWLAGRDHYPICGERTARFLNWRFFDYPPDRFSCFAVRDEESLLGYVVYQVVDGHWHVEDTFATDTDALLTQVLPEFTLHARGNRAETIVFHLFGNQRIIEALATFGFKARGDFRTMVVFSPEDCAEAETIYRKDNWFFFHADNDVDM